MTAAKAKPHTRGAPDDFAPIEEIIEEVGAGRMIVLADRDNPERVGCLVMAADNVSPDAINFMAMHARGLICLGLTAERVKALGLKPLERRHADRSSAAFTNSIEACENVSTGISALDRAQTIRVATDPGFGPEAIASPGHIFPLCAREGGVLVRPGHTEASVDICHLANRAPAAVMCHILRDDGEIAQWPDIIAFGRQHGLKIGLVGDVVAYRLRQGGLFAEVDRKEVQLPWGGQWTSRSFKDRTTGRRHLVLSLGEVDTDEPVLARVHILNPSSDDFGLFGEGDAELSSAMERIAREGRGVVVLLKDTADGYTDDGLDRESVLREFGRGAQLLSALGVKRLRVLSHSVLPRFPNLEAFGLKIVGSELIEN